MGIKIGPENENKEIKKNERNKTRSKIIKIKSNRSRNRKISEKQTKMNKRTGKAN
jgi:hypothetical protein